MLTVLDPSLRDTFSHHHVLNTHLSRCAAKAGLGFRVVGHRKAAQAAGAFGYAVEAHFRRSIYEDAPGLDNDAHAQQVQAHAEDVAAWWTHAAPGARVVVHSATAALLSGLAHAWDANPAAVAAMVVQLMFRPESMALPGMDVSVAWSRYRHALWSLADAARQAGARLTLATSCDEFARAFDSRVADSGRQDAHDGDCDALEDSRLVTIEVHPQTLFSRDDRLLLKTRRLGRDAGLDVQRGAVGRGEPHRVLLFAGDPKLDKGLAWVVQSLPALLQRSRADGAGSGLQCWLHLGPNRFASAEIEALYQQVRLLQLEHDHLRVAWGYLAPAEWARMLSAMDAVLLPYDPTVYLHKTSGILGECLWRLRPDARLLLTPGGWLEREARHWNLGFATCPYGDVDALLSCMHRWDSLLPLGTPAATAPALWARHFGVGNDEWMVEKLMGGA